MLAYQLEGQRRSTTVETRHESNRVDVSIGWLPLSLSLCEGCMPASLKK